MSHIRRVIPVNDCIHSTQETVIFTDEALHRIALRAMDWTGESLGTTFAYRDSEAAMHISYPRGGDDLLVKLTMQHHNQKPEDFEHSMRFLSISDEADAVESRLSFNTDEPYANELLMAVARVLTVRGLSADQPLSDDS